MKLDTRAFAFAAGTTAAVLFILCALGVALAPTSTTAFFGLIMHMDLTGIARSVTVGSFLVGLVAWSLGTALTFGFASWVYNRVVGTRPTEIVQARVAGQRV